jgi:hypothetical protein
LSFTVRIWPPGEDIEQVSGIVDAIYLPQVKQTKLVTTSGKEMKNASLFGAIGDVDMWLERESRDEMTRYDSVQDPHRTPGGYVRFWREDGFEQEKAGKLRRIKDIEA